MFPWEEGQPVKRKKQQLIPIERRNNHLVSYPSITYHSIFTHSHSSRYSHTFTQHTHTLTHPFPISLTLFLSRLHTPIHHSPTTTHTFIYIMGEERQEVSGGSAGGEDNFLAIVRPCALLLLVMAMVKVFLAVYNHSNWSGFPGISTGVYYMH